MIKFNYFDVKKILKDSQPIYFFDFDGTLTEIEPIPSEVQLSIGNKESLIKLSTKHPISIISGRTIEDLKNKVGIDGIEYIGNHGLEFTGVELNIPFSTLERCYLELIEKLSHYQGLLIENKKYSLSIHFRNVQEHSLNKLKSDARKLLYSYPSLTVSEGKMVLNVYPRFNWNKGKAIDLILSKHNRDTVIALFFGDDENDESAFKSINKANGISVYIGDSNSSSNATFYLNSVNCLSEVLKRFAKDL